MIRAKTDLHRCEGKRLLGILLFCAAVPFGTLLTHAAQVTAHTGEITLPTYGWAAVKHPYFRGTDGVNIYPYPMLDFLSRDKTNRTYRTVVLENEYLRITFLPELGGKIHEVLDKTTGLPRERTGKNAPDGSAANLSRGEPMFYVNHVVKPGLIGQCGAWTSGGVEWNTGPQGHTVSCMQPVDVVILPPEKDGSRSVAIGETERIYRTKWTVVVTLRPGRSFIEERIRIYNPTETVRPYYFWNCTAVPNTPGFRFIYPMTLGCDHAGEKFFNWPVDHGKDLTRGTNYQDASSIFAWHCDQDFFGSYNDDLDRGVVAYANHHQLPGKKAWTWGHGGFGKMHQMDLTDDDGPYNEVQTGPLLTQAQVGRLDPCEAVEWKEWWYPIHGIGGFTFANKDVAVNVTITNGQLRLYYVGTGDFLHWRPEVSKWGDKKLLRRSSNTSVFGPLPNQPQEAQFEIGEYRGPFEVAFRREGMPVLAQFKFPLDLPARRPPEPAKPPTGAAGLVQSGWQHFLFARFSEAETEFSKAAQTDPQCAEAYVGLAHLNLDRDPAKARDAALKAIEVAPDSGPALYVLAVSDYRRGDEAAALEFAWRAALNPATAVAARALAAKILVRRMQPMAAVEALAGGGPWRGDPFCLTLLALASIDDPTLAGTNGPAAEYVIATLNTALEIDPLDWFAYTSLRQFARPNTDDDRNNTWVRARANGGYAFGDLALHFMELGENWKLGSRLSGLLKRTPQGILGAFLFDARGPASPTPLAALPEAWVKREWANWSKNYWRLFRPAEMSAAFPYQRELEPMLRWAVNSDAADGYSALYLGHLLFHLGRHAEGREMWKRAAELGAEPVIAYRALGMAAKTLDNDLPSARDWLTKANQADPKDSIVARDLANVLFALADKAESDAEKRALAAEARDLLKAAFAEGKGRSDFVALLARAHNRLGEFAETARLLDTVRVTIWEGAHEVHDLFVQSHLALGEAHLKAGRAAEALAEFNRALEYPANLATGRLENAREAHINYLRGNALAAIGRNAEAIAAWKLAADEPESKDLKLEEARKKAKEALDNISRE